MKIEIIDGYSYKICERGLMYGRESIFDSSNKLLIVHSHIFLIKKAINVFRFTDFDSYDVSHKELKGDEAPYDKYTLVLKDRNHKVLWYFDTVEYDDFVSVKRIVEDLIGIDNISRELDEGMIKCQECLRLVSPAEVRCVYCGRVRNSA